MPHLAIHGGSPVRSKPFPAWPVFGDGERKALQEVLESGEWGGVSHRLTKTFEEQFAGYHQADYGVSVTNGTAALEIALRALGIGFGDEVILAPYTFVASATAVVMNNAIPVFCDVDPETCNIDPDLIEQHITPKTKAIMAVHIAGLPCDMDQILQIAQKHDLHVVEDAAQAHGAEWGGCRVGSIGDLGTFSFQSSKNLNAGEGGMILTNDQELYDRCWSIHNVGRIPGGRWYEHRNLGSNYRMTEWQAAILLQQMKRLPEQMRTRESNATYLAEKLAQIPGIQPLKRDSKVTSHAYHLFIFRYQTEDFGNAPKARFIEALCAEGIPCSSGYVPLYREELFSRVVTSECPFACRHVEREVDYSRVTCPEAERLSEHEAVWFNQSMLLGTRADMDNIVEAVAKIQQHHAELDAS